MEYYRGIQAEPTNPVQAIDPTIHNTGWIFSHFHIMLALYSVGGVFGALYAAGHIYSEGNGIARD